jgi:tetratricopeptide (TPR) repeat protein
LNYYRLDKHDKAVLCYSRAIQYAPNGRENYFHRGDVYRKLRKWEKAVDSYTKAISLCPGFIAAYHNRGLAYEGLGQLQKALTNFNQAVEVRPMRSIHYCSRGQIYAKLEQYDFAFEDYSKALSLNPTPDIICEVLYNRAKIYEKQGKYELAVADVSEAIKASPNQRDEFFNVDEARVQLEKLQSLLKPIPVPAVRTAPLPPPVQPTLQSSAPMARILIAQLPPPPMQSTPATGKQPIATQGLREMVARNSQSQIPPPASEYCNPSRNAINPSYPLTAKN